MKCKQPLKHNPQFEGKHNCKRCEVKGENKMKILERWIYETVKTIDGEFTIDELKDKIVNKKGKSNLIGSNTQIAAYCRRYANRISESTYRRRT